MESYLTAEISASAVAANLALLRQRVKPPTRMCAVVKADCYGHGIDLLLNVISRTADCLAVATPQEAIWLRNLGYERQILVFFSACGYAGGSELQDVLEELVFHHVTLTVVSASEAAAVAEAAEKVGADAEVHLKVDTGMGRSGVGHAGAAAMLERIGAHPRVKVTGLYTHLASADDADKTHAREQIQRFKELAGKCPRRGQMTFHAANSAAIIDLPESHLDMVRPGIAMYGYQPSDDMHNKLPLRPAMRVYGKLMQVKDVPAGHGVGYGLTYTLNRHSRLGLVAIGYADGYFRCLSNKATMRVCGKDVPIRGRVSMDQIILDLTDVPEAHVGHEVEIISSDPAAPHSVENLARLAGTIPYEITCRLGKRVRRVLVD